MAYNFEVDSAEIMEMAQQNAAQGAALAKIAGDSHDFSDDPLNVQANAGSVTSMQVPWWIWLVIAAAVYKGVK